MLSVDEYYLNLAPINGYMRWRKELVKGRSQPLRQWRQVVEHNPAEVPMSITLDKPTDMPDIAHQAQQAIARNLWQRHGQPSPRPDQHVMRQGVQQHHDLLRREALLIPLA